MRITNLFTIVIISQIQVSLCTSITIIKVSFQSISEIIQRKTLVQKNALIEQCGSIGLSAHGVQYKLESKFERRFGSSLFCLFTVMLLFYV